MKEIWMILEGLRAKNRWKVKLGGGTVWRGIYIHARIYAVAFYSLWSSWKMLVQIRSPFVLFGDIILDWIRSASIDGCRWFPNVRAWWFVELSLRITKARRSEHGHDNNYSSVWPTFFSPQSRIVESTRPLAAYSLWVQITSCKGLTSYGNLV